MGLHIVRRSSGDGGKSVSSNETLTPSKLFASMPALWEFLTVERWEDEATRTTGTLLMFCEDGKVKLCLNDRDQDLVGFVTGSTLEEVLKVAEKSLVDDTVDWRKSRRQGGGKR